MDTVSFSPLVVRAGGGSVIDLGDQRFHVKVSAYHNGDQFMLTEVEADYNAGVPPHLHRVEDETFVILSGKVEFGIGEQVIEAGPGDTVFAPRNIAHTWRCTSPEGARFLIWFTPGANFHAFSLAMAARSGAPKDAMADPVQIGEFIALAERHGIEMLPPGK